MGLRRPLSIEGCADFDMIDENLKGFFSATCIGDVANGEEFIPPRECCFQFSEGVSLYVTQWYMEIDKLWVVRRCGNGDVMLTDHLREIGVVAGMGTENQTQAGVFIGLHRRSPGPDANTHDPFIGKEAVQVQFQLVGVGESEDNRRNRWRLARDRIWRRVRHAAGEMNSLARFLIQ